MRRKRNIGAALGRKPEIVAKPEVRPDVNAGRVELREHCPNCRSVWGIIRHTSKGSRTVRCQNCHTRVDELVQPAPASRNYQCQRCYDNGYVTILNPATNERRRDPCPDRCHYGRSWARQEGIAYDASIAGPGSCNHCGRNQWVNGTCTHCSYTLPHEPGPSQPNYMVCPTMEAHCTNQDCALNGCQNAFLG